MNSVKEKLLQRIDPKLLEMTPKLTSSDNSVIDLDSGKDTLKPGAKELMLRFFKKQELFFKSISTEEGIELTDTNYNESFQFCRSISERLSLPFSHESFNVDKPIRKKQELKKKLEEKMADERFEKYKQRMNEYNKWITEQNEKEGKEDSDDEENDFESESENSVTKDNHNNVLNEDESENKINSNSDNVDFQKTETPNENNIENEDMNKRGPMTDTSNTIDSNNATLTKILDEDYDIAENNSTSSVSNDNLALTNDKNLCEINNFDFDDDDSDSCKNSLIPPYQPRGGMSYSVGEQTQCSQGLPQNIMSPSLRFTLSDSQSSRNLDATQPEENLSILHKKKLFSDLEGRSDSFDISDAFQFCSGKFPEDSSQKVSQMNLGCKESNYSEEQLSDGEDADNEHWSDDDEDDDDNEDDDNDDNNNDDDDDDDDVDAAETEKLNSSKSKKRIIMLEESDEEADDTIAEQSKKENDNEDEDEDKNLKIGKIMSDDEDEKATNFKKKKKRTKKMLNFSDEEDEANDDFGSDNDDEGDESDVESENENDECDRRSVFYDSEENEITNAREFFEREAELSGSEVSGDEDERGLDEFDAEAGDADDLDYNKIQSQLGKIHLRRLLDDDSRNVRLLQELLFEDGDLQVDPNEKKFKWKNLVTSEEQVEFNNPEVKDDNVESSDEDDTEDLQMRRERLERLLLAEKLKEKGELSSDCDLFKMNFRKLRVTSIKDLLNVPAKSEAKDKDKVGNYARAVDGPVNCVLQNKKGSFLMRGENELTKLAKVTSAFVDNVRGSKNSKNFVFASKSPEKVEPEKKELKRAMEEPQNYSSKKKLKLSSDNNQMPSILDLLG